MSGLVVIFAVLCEKTQNHDIQPMVCDPRIKRGKE